NHGDGHWFPAIFRPGKSSTRNARQNKGPLHFQYNPYRGHDPCGHQKLLQNPPWFRLFHSSPSRCWLSSPGLTLPVLRLLHILQATGLPAKELQTIFCSFRSFLSSSHLDSLYKKSFDFLCRFCTAFAYFLGTV